MAGNQSEERIGRAMIFQAWRSVAFLHWAVVPEVVASRPCRCSWTTDVASCIAVPTRRRIRVVVAIVGKRIAMPSTDEPGGEGWAPSPGEKQPAEGGREEVEEQLAAQSRDERAEADDEDESDEVEEH